MMVNVSVTYLMHDAQITLCVHVDRAKVSDTQCLSVTGTGFCFLNM